MKIIKVPVICWILGDSVVRPHDGKLIVLLVVPGLRYTDLKTVGSWVDYSACCVILRQFCLSEFAAEKWPWSGADSTILEPGMNGLSLFLFWLWPEQVQWCRELMDTNVQLHPGKQTTLFLHPSLTRHSWFSYTAVSICCTGHLLINCVWKPKSICKCWLTQDQTWWWRPDMTLNCLMVFSNWLLKYNTCVYVGQVFWIPCAGDRDMYNWIEFFRIICTWWWWWLMFYGHFCAHGRLNGPSYLQM